MLRNVIRIDQEKCDGCGDCVSACHEAAIVIVDGKAQLVGDRYCDGLGDCLGECPQGAITMEMRETEDYDEVAVRARIAARMPLAAPCAGSCPGSAPRDLRAQSRPEARAEASTHTTGELGHWPVQLRLLHPASDALAGSELRVYSYEERERRRIYQFDRSRGVTGFPDRPQEVLEEWRARLAQEGRAKGA